MIGPVLRADPEVIDRALESLPKLIAAARAAKAEGFAPRSMRIYRHACDLIALELLTHLSIAGDEARVVSSKHRGADGARAFREDGAEVIAVQTIEQVARDRVKEVESFLHEAKTLLDFGYKDDALESYDYALETVGELSFPIRQQMDVVRTGKPFMMRTVRVTEAGA